MQPGQPVKKVTGRSILSMDLLLHIMHMEMPELPSPSATTDATGHPGLHGRQVSISENVRRSK